MINEDGAKSGFGQALYYNNDMYIGLWENDQKNGLGIQMYREFNMKGYKIYFG